MKKFAQNGFVKPQNNTIQIKRERMSTIKTERDIDDEPFDSTDVYCGHKSPTEDSKTKIKTLTVEKQKLIEDMMVTKAENQDMYFQLQNKQQMVSFLENEKNELQKTLTHQQQLIAELTREKFALQAKIKQLMSSTSANPSFIRADTNTHEETNDEFEVESILDHKGKKKGLRRFLIRWKNYSPSHDSWEKECNLNCSS